MDDVPIPPDDMTTIRDAVYMLADAEHDLDTHLWQSRSNPAFFAKIEARRNDLHDSIPDGIKFTATVFDAYCERLRQRNWLSERGLPFTLIDGSAS